MDPPHDHEQQRQDALRALGRGDDEPAGLVSRWRSRRAQQSASPAPPEGDLAEQRAGDAVSEQIRAQRRQRPVRSLIDRAQGKQTSWEQGRRGEQRVGRALDKLERHGWHTLHAIPIGAALGRDDDLDHLTIGPGGAFAINSKSLNASTVTVTAEDVWIGGRRYDHLPKAWLRAAEAGVLLAAALERPVDVVQGLLVYVDTQLQIRSQPHGIGVATLAALPTLLRNLPTGLSQAEIDELYAAARDPHTWTGPQATHALEAHYQQLHQRIEPDDQAHELRTPGPDVADGGRRPGRRLERG